MKYTNMLVGENSLDIDDCKLEIIRTYDAKQDVTTKELLISYKTIFINTYNVQLYDISAPLNKRATLYIHESF